MKLFGDLIEIDGVSVLDEKRREFIRGTLRRLGSKRLLSTYNKIDQIRHGDKPTNNYYVVFPCNFYHGFSGPMCFITIELEIHDLKSLEKNFNSNQMISTIKSDKALNDKKLSYVVFEQLAFDEYDALNKANDKIEIFRSLLNFYKSYGSKAKETIKPKHLSVIQTPKYGFVLDKNKKYLTKSDVFGEYDYTPVKFDDRELIQISSMIHKTNKIKDFNLKMVFFKALMRHTSALDEAVFDSAYERYWRVLETVALHKKNNKLCNIEICNRVKALLEDENSYPVSKLFHKRKNSGSICVNDINNIKSLSEESILFLINNLDVLDHSKKLEDLYLKKSHKINVTKNSKKGWFFSSVINR